MEMFELASRSKVRYQTPQGLLSVEDLWDLPLTSAKDTRASLDAIAVDLHRQIKDAADTVSFVTPSTADASLAKLHLRFEIVKHVIQVRVAERDALKEQSDRREKKARLLELIARKQDQELEEKSVDELMALANSL